MNLFINGEDKSFADSLSLAQLVEHLGMKGDRVAVELNREIVLARAMDRNTAQRWRPARDRALRRWRIAKQFQFRGFGFRLQTSRELAASALLRAGEGPFRIVSLLPETQKLQAGNSLCETSVNDCPRSVDMSAKQI